MTRREGEVTARGGTALGLASLGLWVNSYTPDEIPLCHSVAALSPPVALCLYKYHGWDGGGVRVLLDWCVCGWTRFEKYGSIG